VIVNMGMGNMGLEVMSFKTRLIKMEQGK
jgi:hypothetical protein